MGVRILGVPPTPCDDGSYIGCKQRSLKWGSNELTSFWMA